jgi:hypothetical protein
MLAIFKRRPHSYDQDWMGAFQAAGFQLTDQPTKFHDLTVILQSVTAQWEGIPEWISNEAVGFTGMLVFFPGNEYALFERKNKAALDLKATIATQLPIEAAKRIYTAPVIEVPHALNPDFFFPEGSKKAEIGVRGNPYKPGTVGDDERNRICGMWKDLKHDCSMGKETFLTREAWRDALRKWRCMPSTEGGAVGAKCVTPRHFDAIGTHTCLVMYPGFFNGILKPEHYITLERDHSNLVDVRRQIKDADHCLKIVSKAREYCLDGHTYAHRVRQVLEQ